MYNVAVSYMYVITVVVAAMLVAALIIIVVLVCKFHRKQQQPAPRLAFSVYSHPRSLDH